MSSTHLRQSLRQKRTRSPLSKNVIRGIRVTGQTCLPCHQRIIDNGSTKYEDPPSKTALGVYVTSNRT